MCFAIFRLSAKRIKNSNWGKFTGTKKSKGKAGK